MLPKGSPLTPPRAPYPAYGHLSPGGSKEKNAPLHLSRYW